MPRTAHFSPPPLHRGVEENPSKREPYENKNSKISQQFRAVIEHVMTHLMRHYHANFRERALLEQIVIERDACRAEKS